MEKKIDNGFAEMRTESKEVRAQILATERALRGEIVSARSDARTDFRTLIAVTLGMWVTTILAIVGAVLQHQV